MFQVTAIYQDCEVGYGESDSESNRGLAYALEECIESVDSFYRPVLSDVTLHVIGAGIPARLTMCSARAVISRCS